MVYIGVCSSGSSGGISDADLGATVTAGAVAARAAKYILL